MKLPALVRLMAEDDERGEAALKYIARVIREAGHMPTTKRGSGASDMGVQEVANFLIAANATDVPSRLSEVVNTFRKLRQVPTRKSEGGISIESSKWWKTLCACTTFGEALEFLIAQNEKDREDVCQAFNLSLGASRPYELLIFRAVRFGWPEATASILLNVANAEHFRDGLPPDADLSGKRFEIRFALTEADRLFLEDQKPSGRIHEVTVRDSVIRRLSDACAAASTEAPDKEAVA